MKLYEIKDQYVQALREVCELNDCTPEEAAGMLDKLDGELDDKVLAVAATIKNLEADYEAMGNYIDAMMTKKMAVSKKIRWMRDYIKTNMLACHKKKIKGLEIDISVRNTRPSLQIATDAFIPGDFIREEIKQTIHKEALREYLEKGKVVEGVELIPQTALFIL